MIVCCALCIDLNSAFVLHSLPHYTTLHYLPVFNSKLIRSALLPWQHMISDDDDDDVIICTHLSLCCILAMYVLRDQVYLHL